MNLDSFTQHNGEWLRASVMGVRILAFQRVTPHPAFAALTSALSLKGRGGRVYTTHELFCLR